MNMYKYDVINVDASGEKHGVTRWTSKKTVVAKINGEEANVTSLIHWCWSLYDKPVPDFPLKLDLETVPSAKRFETNQNSLQCLSHTFT